MKGCAYYVFPGASHNRLEHCLGECALQAVPNVVDTAALGVGHLASQSVQLLRRNQPELDINDRVGHGGGTPLARSRVLVCVIVRGGP